VKVTDNFDSIEWACKSGHLYPDAWVEARLRPLCQTLEVLRAAIGRPIIIISGYRDADYNERLRAQAQARGAKGPAKNSQHIEGRAADIRVAGMDPGAVHAKMLELYGQGALPHLGGLGLYPKTAKASGFVHVDVRPRKPDGSIARWSGKGVET
jgi:uncharacterized protein YcbK (DUF882 family)